MHFMTGNRVSFLQIGLIGFLHLEVRRIARNKVDRVFRDNAFQLTNILIDKGDAVFSVLELVGTHRHVPELFLDFNSGNMIFGFMAE